MEELKKAEVALFASGHEPDYAQNECVLTLIHFHKTNHLFFFSFNKSEFNYTQWETKEIFEKRFLEKLDDEQVKSF
jgi:hypothetical protein